jgi:hypothetical protein
VIYGAIIGLALIVALEHHPPPPGVMVGTLLATAVAVGLAELYSEVVGTETRTRRRVGRAGVRRMLDGVGAVALGIAFPCVFFILAAAGSIEDETAFTIAKWSGLALIGFYGFSAGRLSGAGVAASLLQAIVVGTIGGALIAFKALVH